MARKSQNADIAAALGSLADAVKGISERLDRIESGSIDDRGADRQQADRRSQSRTGQTRAANSRAAEERVMPHMGYQSRLHINPKKIPPDKRYYWVATSVLGQPMDDNITRHQMAGWSPVPADRHPELIPPPLPGRENEIPQFITAPGLILMEKPENLVRQAESWLRQQNMLTLKSQIKGGEQLNEDDRMPWTVEVDQGSIERVAIVK